MEDITAVMGIILPCNTIVYRSATTKKIDEDTGKLHGEAFLLRPADLGLSVIFCQECPTCKEVESLLDLTRIRAVDSLHVGTILDLGDDRGLKLKVVLDDPDKPHHAHILGLPNLLENEKLAHDIAEDFAENSRLERRLFPSKINEE